MLCSPTVGLEATQLQWNSIFNSKDPPIQQGFSSLSPLVLNCSPKLTGPSSCLTVTWQCRWHSHSNTYASPVLLPLHTWCSTTHCISWDPLRAGKEISLPIFRSGTKWLLFTFKPSAALGLLIRKYLPLLFQIQNLVSFLNQNLRLWFSFNEKSIAFGSLGFSPQKS